MTALNQRFFIAERIRLSFLMDFKLSVDVVDGPKDGN
jgi:hypothetical protein